jgi:hypothetical protein
MQRKYPEWLKEKAKQENIQKRKTPDVPQSIQARS